MSTGEVLLYAPTPLAVAASASLHGRAESLLAGEQYLFPFRRRLRTLPAQPGEMVRQKSMVPQAEITASGFVRRIP
jgi:hypothetical protein